MFQLNPAEVNNLRSHFATSKKKHGGRRYEPYFFTEHGVIMLAAVLNPRGLMRLAFLRSGLLLDSVKYYRLIKHWVVGRA